MEQRAASKHDIGYSHFVLHSIASGNQKKIIGSHTYNKAPTENITTLSKFPAFPLELLPGLLIFIYLYFFYLSNLKTAQGFFTCIIMSCNSCIAGLQYTLHVNPKFSLCKKHNKDRHTLLVSHFCNFCFLCKVSVERQPITLLGRVLL